MYELADVVSFVGTGVALSFVAYLLGVFAQGLWRKTLLIAARTLGRQAIIYVTESGTFELEVDPSEIPAEPPDQGDLAQTDAKGDDGQDRSRVHAEIDREARRYVRYRAFSRYPYAPAR